jgi:hypothetical protein
MNVHQLSPAPSDISLYAHRKPVDAKRGYDPKVDTNPNVELLELVEFLND